MRHLFAILTSLFENCVFIYGTTLLSVYVLLGIMSYFSIRKFQNKEYLSNYEDLFTSPLAPGISVLAPAYNEGLSIVMNVRSLLTLRYPVFEIVLINDGSTDDSLEQVIHEFELKKVSFAYNEKIRTQPIRGIYKSKNKAFSNLTVIDKENGKSKADAVNAGINAAAFNYFVCTDVDCILSKDALLKLIKPVLEEKTKQVIAVGATLRIANSCDIDHGVMLRMRPPKQLLPRFQEMEYIRAFVLGKMGWSLINCVPNVSGGLGLFDKDVAIKSGGYDPLSFGEDMELMIRMIRFAYDNNLKYAIRYIPQTLCWTEAPTTIKTLMRQRTRWARGLSQLMYSHFKMMLNPHYGRAGMILFPYNFFFELMAPFVELTGISYLIYLFTYGRINIPFAILVFVFTYLCAIMITTTAILWDQLAFRSYKTFREVLFLWSTVLFEFALYHPLNVVFALRGYYFFLTGKKHSWGDMQRQGFGNTEIVN